MKKNDCNTLMESKDYYTPETVEASKYLDEFFDEASSKYKALEESVSSKHKDKEINIFGCIIYLLYATAIIILLIGKNSSNPTLKTLYSFAPVFIIILAVISVLLRTLAGVKVSIFFTKEEFMRQEMDSQLYMFKADENKLKKYLGAVNKKVFKGEQSYCITGPTCPAKTVSMVKYALLTCLLVCGGCNIFAISKDGIHRGAQVCLEIMLLCFVVMGIFIFFEGVLSPYLKHKSNHYDEIVDAVCVEVDQSYVEEKDHRRISVYQPILYTRCSNGHKYILCNNSYSNRNIPYVGKIIKIKVDSSNPINYHPIDYHINKDFLLVGICFTVFPLFAYIWLIIN